MDELAEKQSKKRSSLTLIISFYCPNKVPNLALIPFLHSLRLQASWEIENLIAGDRIEEALNLLRGQFKDDSDVIKLLQRLYSLHRQFSINGTLSLKEYGVEKNNIAEGVKTVLKEL